MDDISHALKLHHRINVTGEDNLPSRYCVTDLAVNSIGAVGAAIASMSKSLNLANNTDVVTVNRKLASLWFSQSIKPIGWGMPPLWDAIAGDYQTKDGWIKLHTNLPHHRNAVCKVLGVKGHKEDVKIAVQTWEKDKLEQAIVDAGGVAAAIRTRIEWQKHLQGRAVAQEPLISRSNPRQISSKEWNPTMERPLTGVKILDLTRVLAGPVATRTLAGFGATVLRIDPPNWEEPNIVPDITLGKRCSRLDLKNTKAQETFKQLLREADILIHGYRPGALEALGLGEKWRNEVAPELVDISLNAYGWTGPWAERRGFDSLVQMSCGIAHAGMSWAGNSKPTPLPVQALDHATGYLMAAAAIKALEDRILGNFFYNTRLSLARTAEFLIAHEQTKIGKLSKLPSKEDFSAEIEHTKWGPAQRLIPPITIGDISMKWDLPANALGSSPCSWP